MVKISKVTGRRERLFQIIRPKGLKINVGILKNNRRTTMINSTKSRRKLDTPMHIDKDKVYIFYIYKNNISSFDGTPMYIQDNIMFVVEEGLSLRSKIKDRSCNETRKNIRGIYSIHKPIEYVKIY